MKTVFSLLAMSAVLFHAAEDTKQSAEQKIRGLHDERIATLKSLVDLTETLGKRNGAASPKVIIESQVMLLNAEFEAAEHDRERIVFQERTVEALKKLETLLERARETGEYPYIEFFKVKAERLKAEITLEKLKSGAGDLPK